MLAAMQGEVGKRVKRPHGSHEAVELLECGQARSYTVVGRIEFSLPSVDLRHDELHERYPIRVTEVPERLQRVLEQRPCLLKLALEQCQHPQTIQALTRLLLIPEADAEFLRLVEIGPRLVEVAELQLGPSDLLQRRCDPRGVAQITIDRDRLPAKPR